MKYICANPSLTEKEDIGSDVLTDDDQSAGLEELLIVPGRMFCLQDVTDSVVLPQPYGGVHAEARQEAEHLLTNGQTVFWKDAFRVQHVHRDLGCSRRVHIPIYCL